MLTGVFNSIIYQGFRAIRAVANVVAKFLTKSFNNVCQAVSKVIFGEERNGAPSAEKPLHKLFNRFCNDNLSFHGGEEEQSPEKAARIRHLMSFLKVIMQRLSIGAAQVQDALSVVQELQSLGVSVGGLAVLHPHAEPPKSRPVTPAMAA